MACYYQSMDSDSAISRKRYDDKQLRHAFPYWLPALYGAACIFLIPWTAVLAYFLPPRYDAHHWGIAWAGFDIFEIVLFALTALLAVRKSSWTALTATMLGTVLVVDAWFDVLTARTGWQQQEALVEAVVEVSIAAVSYWLAHRIFNDVRHRQIKP